MLHTNDVAKRNVLPEVIQKKLQFLGYICGMKDDQKVILVFGSMNGNNRMVPRSTCYVIADCKASLQELSCSACSAQDNLMETDNNQRIIPSMKLQLMLSSWYIMMILGIIFVIDDVIYTLNVSCEWKIIGLQM